MKNVPTYREFGEGALLIDWPAKIDDATNEAVLQMEAFISETYKKEIIETVPAYHSLAIYLKRNVSVSEFIKTLQQTEASQLLRIPNTKSLITIPVCYDPKYAIDIDYVAETHDISTSEVIKIHTQPTYKVFFLGFLPGFPYLGGLDKRLITPRKSTPRRFIAIGSVAIGGSQTGIYTSDAPGGWNIIGKSPLQFFKAESSTLSLLHPGDNLKFVSVSRKEYKKIRDEVSNGSYKIDREVYRD